MPAAAGAVPNSSAPRAARSPVKERTTAITLSGPSPAPVGRRSVAATVPVRVTIPPFIEVPPTSTATTYSLIPASPDRRRGRVLPAGEDTSPVLFAPTHPSPG